MSGGAPCQQGTGQVWLALLLGQEVPERALDREGIKIKSKKTRQERHQHHRRLRWEVAASAAKTRSQVDESWCWNVVWEEIRDFRHSTRVVSQGLDLCESTAYNGVSEVHGGLGAGSS